METRDVWQETFRFFAQKPIVVEPVEDCLSTDAGLLPIRQLDEALGLPRVRIMRAGQHRPMMRVASIVGIGAALVSRNGLKVKRGRDSASASGPVGLTAAPDQEGTGIVDARQHS